MNLEAPFEIRKMDERCLKLRWTEMEVDIVVTVLAKKTPLQVPFYEAKESNSDGYL